MPRLTIKYLRMLYFIARINTKVKSKKSFSRMMTDVEWNLAMAQLKELNINL